MRKLALLAVVFTACVPLTASADDHVVVSADQLKWVAAPPSFPKGAQIAVLSGDPSKEGLYVVRLKAPAGYKVPARIYVVDAFPITDSANGVKIQRARLRAMAMERIAAE